MASHRRPAPIIMWYNVSVIRTPFVLALALVVGCAGRQPAAPPEPPRPTYLCMRIVDGDTIIVRDGSGVQTRIRLAGIDAPERGEPGFQQAADALAAKLLNRRVTLRVYALDRYGRTVADVLPVD